MYLTVCPPSGPGSIPVRGGVYQGIFPWRITSQSPLNGTSQHADIKEEGQSLTIISNCLTCM